MSRFKSAGKWTAAGAGIIALVGAWEGLRTKAYIPIKGDVATICFGETRGVKLGDQKTIAECKQMLGDRLIEFSRKIDSCLVNPDAIPDKSYIAFVSLAYNIGTGAFCRSTVVRLANSGDIKGACQAILRFNRAGGRVVQGLVNRRTAEQALCLEGLK